MFVKVLELLWTSATFISWAVWEREREINHAKVNFRLHVMLPGIRRVSKRLSLAKMSWLQFSDSLSEYIPSKSPVSYSISTFQVPRPTCSPQVTMPKSQVDKDIGVAVFLNASVVARDPCWHGNPSRSMSTWLQGQLGRLLGDSDAAWKHHWLSLLWS